MWYTIAKLKAIELGDTQAVADAKTGLNILALRNTGTTTDDGGCNSACQLAARTLSLAWTPTTNGCQLQNRVATRENFCSGFGYVRQY